MNKVKKLIEIKLMKCKENWCKSFEVISSNFCYFFFIINNIMLFYFLYQLYEDIYSENIHIVSNHSSIHKYN